MPQDKNDKRNVSGAQFQQPSEEFAVRSASAIAGFDFETANPPSLTYVGVDDRLVLWALWGNNQAAINCNLRILTPSGEIIPLSFSLAGANPHAIFTQQFQLVEGWILSAALVGGNGASNANLVYGAAGILRPPNTLLSQYETLLAGYVNSQIALSYPNGVPMRMVDGPGAIHSVVVGNPAAGADFTFTIPALSRMRIVSLTATLTTSAAVANRNPALILDDGANVFAEINSGANQAASLTQEYTWGDSFPFGALFGGNLMMPLPAQLFMVAGFRIRSETTLIDVADQWSAITLLVHEWADAG